MRIALQHAAVHEGAGVALVGVADDVLLRALALGDRRPLQPGRVTRAAAAAQAALGDGVDDLGGRHLRERVARAPVAVRGDVLLDPLGVDPAAVLQHDGQLAGEERMVEVQPRHRLGPLREARDDGGGVGGGDVARRAYRSGRPAPAAPRSRAAGSRPSLTVHVLPPPLPLDRRVELLAHGLGAAGQAAGRRAAADPERRPVRTLLLGQSHAVQRDPSASQPFTRATAWSGTCCPAIWRS